jgi:RND family efflux transporter MFP subunit
VNPVFTIYDIDKMKIYADVSEKDYSLLKRGARAQIKLDAFPGQLFLGSVNNIRPVIDPYSRTTQVEILLPNPGHRIKPGMFATVSLVLISKPNVMIIPFDAVLGETDKYVFVSAGNLAVKKPIKLGLQEDENVEVVSGLSAKDKVIVLGERVAKEGSKVEETSGQ